MQTAKTSGGQSSSQILDYNALLALLKPKKLDSVYREFMELTNAPQDLKCLLIVAVDLHYPCGNLRAWRQIGPFKGWPMLMCHLCVHARMIEQQFGPIVKLPASADDQSGGRETVLRKLSEVKSRSVHYMRCYVAGTLNPDLKVSVRVLFQLPTFCMASRNPRFISVSLDKPRQTTMLPGRGSLARAR